MPQVVDLAFLPWYSSEAVLGTLGDGFLAATETLRDFHAVFFHALEHAGAPPLHPSSPRSTRVPMLPPMERII